MEQHTCFSVIILGVLCLATSVTSQCNQGKAEVCITQMEDVITTVLETTAGVDRNTKLQQLCLDVIKGNNLTQCFIDATRTCPESSRTSGQGDAIKRWETVMQDLYGLCDGACPNFLERTVNITQCTGIIRFDALYDSSYHLFCQSLNESLQCVSEVSDRCPQFGNLFYDLLPEGMDHTASTLCTGGCDKFDDALDNLEACKRYVTDLPEDFSEACVSYEQFKTCIRMSEAPITCPMFGSLMEVLYPQHIFGLYDKNCNRTDTDDKCGDIGVARIDHCLRIFALSWPSGEEEEEEPIPTKQQCSDFQTATRCLERAGFAECGALREYLGQKLQGRQTDKLMMEEKCPNLLGNPSSASSTSSMFILTLIFISLMTLVHSTGSCLASLL
ncbi:uncharacterized protein LOC101858973 [Aplysia californica]|uniref:Uncharacterized protein LOC101858973 n=1 Tax=Aplysia californica TaxID=6500 RepID=A0ABM1W1Z2_APLCA|nr:uncharacterized protein LOC101858973 [Aplysia californica]